jgi:hypothetical protein
MRKDFHLYKKKVKINLFIRMNALHLKIIIFTLFLNKKTF